MVGKYSKNELQHGGDTKAEHNRLRGIFDNLIQRGKDGLVLSQAEQDFVYHGLVYFGENENNYSFVDDARFKHLYLIYFLDITGGGVYKKARGRRIIDVPLLEKENDLSYLIDAAEKWKQKVTPGVHQNILLQEVSKEANLDKRKLDRTLNIADNPFLAGTFFYDYKVWGTYLRSRIVYIYAKEILEETNSADLLFTLCGETIEFTEFSMIHILNRHFAEITKQYKSGKDYHPEDIKPRILPKQIKDILTEIDKSGLLKKQLTTEINIRYKGRIYQLWAEWKTKFVIGHSGPFLYKRLQSFYPVSDPTLIATITSSYEEKILNSDLSLFVSIKP